MHNAFIRGCVYSWNISLATRILLVKEMEDDFSAHTYVFCFAGLLSDNSEIIT
jgi:hypothetical protein